MYVLVYGVFTVAGKSTVLSFGDHYNNYNNRLPKSWGQERSKIINTKSTILQFAQLFIY